MTVSIDIDLNAKQAMEKIGRLKIALSSLDDDIGDLGSNFDLDDMEAEIDSLDKKLSNLGDDVDLENINVNAEGSGGDSMDSTKDDFEVPKYGHKFDEVARHFGDERSVRPDLTYLTGEEQEMEIRDPFPKSDSGSRYTPDDDSGSGSEKSTMGQVRDARENLNDVDTSTQYLSEYLDEWDSMDVGDIDEDITYQGKEGQRIGIGDPQRSDKAIDFDTLEVPDGVAEAMGMNSGDLGDGDGSMSVLGKEFDLSKRDSVPNIEFGKATQKSAKISNNMGKVKKRMKGMVPSMQKWRRLLALILPMMVVMGTQAAGVAAAMGSIALAGAAIVGLGLGGHGDTMAESFREAKKEVGDLKEDLFDVFQPTMQHFAPIQEQFFDFAPGAMIPVADSLENLDVFEDAVFQAFSGMMNAVSSAIDLIVELQKPITQLAMRFGDIIATNIADFFRWLVVEASKNQDMLIRLGIAAERILITIYNLSKSFSGLVIALNPLLWIIMKVSQALSGKLGQLFVIISVSAIYLTSTITGLMLSMAKLRFAIILLEATGGTAFSGFAMKAMTALGAVKTSIWSTIAAMSTLQKAIVATGIGALLVGGGMILASQMDSPSQDNTGAGYDYGPGGDSHPNSGYSDSPQRVVNEGDTYNIDYGSNPDQATMDGVKDYISTGKRTENIESLE